MEASKKCNRGYTFQQPRITPLGDSALIVSFGTVIDPEINRWTHALLENIRTHALAGVTALVPAYASLTVHFDPEAWSFDGLRSTLLRLVPRENPSGNLRHQNHAIPVFYGGEHGPDLEPLSRECGLTQEEIVRRHSGAEYLVYFIGFQPGFPYLGGLDATLAASRLKTPRLRVPAGSVGIAGNQTGIYPQDSPGGWRIIGWTPLNLFDPGKDPPALLAAGDTVRFVPLDPQERHEP